MPFIIVENIQLIQMIPYNNVLEWKPFKHNLEIKFIIFDGEKIIIFVLCELMECLCVTLSFVL
jgi:hypothetical protein